MIYLTGYRDEKVDRYRQVEGDFSNLGLILTPSFASYLKKAYIYSPWISWDNGCFSEIGRKRYNEDEYLGLIQRSQDLLGGEVLWATAPDVWGDWQATLASSLPTLPRIRKVCPAAIVAQDGATIGSMPWDEFDVLFVGGSDRFRESRELFQLAAEAKRRNKGLHFGRVNSEARLGYANRLGFHSADGTYLKFRDRCLTGLNVGIGEVDSWLEEINGPDWWRYDRTGMSLKDLKAGIYEEY